MSCRQNFTTTVELGKKLETKMEAVEKNIMNALENRKGTDPGKNLEEKISSMEKTVMEKINEQKEEVEKSLNAQKEVVLAMPTEVQTELDKKTKELKRIVTQREDKERRETNLIIHNIPESQSKEPRARKKYDSGSFNNIVCALFGEGTVIETEQIIRLGKKKEVREDEGEDPKPRLMLVRLRRKEDVDDLIKSRYDLRYVGFSNVYLTRDMTPEEREAHRKMREEKGEKSQRANSSQGNVVPRQ